MKITIVCVIVKLSTQFFVDKLIDMGARVILCDPHRVVVVGLEIHLYTKLLEFIGNYAKVFKTYIFYSDITLRHCCQTYERAYFNHIRKNRMFCSA